MAGSLRWFNYTAEDGSTFAVFMDESNGEAVGNTNYTVAGGGIYTLPGNVEPRAVRYRNNDTCGGRLIIASTQAIAVAAPATITVQDGNGGTEDLTKVGIRAERLTRFPVTIDTGKTDGDTTG